MWLQGHTISLMLSELTRSHHYHLQLNRFDVTEKLNNGILSNRQNYLGILIV